jgi:DNA mismatch endonuclease (patch repair protein)
VQPVAGFRRTADLVFTRVKLAVFVDGCFWHGCPDHHTQAKANAEFWSAKVLRNRERDAETTAVLQAEGWTVLRFWEHDDLSEAARRVAAVYRELLDNLAPLAPRFQGASADLPEGIGANKLGSTDQLRKDPQ